MTTHTSSDGTISVTVERHAVRETTVTLGPWSDEATLAAAVADVVTSVLTEVLAATLPPADVADVQERIRQGQEEATAMFRLADDLSRQLRQAVAEMRDRIPPPVPGAEAGRHQDSSAPD